MSANHATRVLCAAVVVQPAFGDVVFRELCVPRVRTLAPWPGIDMVAVARHAAWAIQQRNRRNGVLSAALLAAVASLVFEVAAPGVGVTLACGVVAAATVWALGDQVRFARRAARIVDVDIDPDLGQGLLPAAHEQRLAAVNDTNLLVYGSALDTDPFPGAGQRVNVRLLQSFDIGKPKDDTKPARAFTPSDLLEHLAKRLPSYIPRTNTAESRRARMVLYANGSLLDQVPGLLPDPLGPPLLRAPSSLLRQVADSKGNMLRTYLRVQVIGHSGELVTTFHLAAEVSPVGLSLDLALHVLRPVNGAFYDARRLPRATGSLVWYLFVREWIVVRLVGAWAAGRNRGGRVDGLFRGRERSLLAALPRVLRGSARLAEARTAPRLTRTQRRGAHARDLYGTGMSVREATSYSTELDHNERTDANKHFNDIFTAILKELVSFLESRNIDPYDLLQEKSNIIQNFTTEFHQTINGSYHAGIHANGNISVGGNLQANANNFPNLAQQQQQQQNP